MDLPVDDIRELRTEDDPDLTGKRLAVHRDRIRERPANQTRMQGHLQRWGSAPP